MENPAVATPVKISPYGDEFGINTPSGGLIFNPFHKEFLNRVGQVNFSPGIFAYNSSPIGKSGSKRNTPNRKNAPFNLSPDIQGDLFPADIDENPVLQLKLQERLDTQCDDEIQNAIHSFFKNHLIAPSPDAFVDSPSKSHTSLLPRTSSLLPTATPVGKKKKNTYMLENNSNPMCEVAVQTAISMPPSFDFESLMLNVLEQNHSTTDSSNRNPTIKLRRTSTEAENLIDNKLHSDSKSALILNNISLSACSVHRPVNWNHTNNNSSASTQRKNPRHWLSRRSLFSDSSEANEEPDCGVVDGDELNEQRTLTSSDDLSNQCNQASCSSAKPTCSTYLSSTQMENAYTKFSVEKFCPDETDCSLTKETAALQMCLPASWADTGISDDDDDDDDDDNDDSYDGVTHNEDSMRNSNDLDNSVSMRTLNGTTIEYTNKNALDDVVSCGGGYSRPMHLSIEYCSSQMNSPKHSDQHFRCGSTSPDVCHTNISFHSPDLSPILPAARHVNNNSVVLHFNSIEDKNTPDIQLHVLTNDDRDNSREIPMPAKCLFPTSLNKSN